MKRRTVLKELFTPVVLAGAALAPSPALAEFSTRAARRRKRLNTQAASTLTDSGELARLYRRAAWTADDRVTFSWLHGTRFALIDSAFTPLWQMHIGNWFTTRDLDGGGFEVTWVTANLYSDLESNKLLERFRNPFTNQVLDVPYRAPRVSKLTFGPDGQRAGDAPAGFTMTRTAAYGPAWLEGDTLWIRGDLAYRGEPTTPDKRMFQVNDWSTYFGSARELLDARVRNPRTSQAFSDINTWPDWLGMAGVAGNFVSRCFGQKAFGYAEMPAAWRGLVEARFPDVARDPVGALRG
jgi:hypothetical protein